MILSEKTVTNYYNSLKSSKNDDLSESCSYCKIYYINNYDKFIKISKKVKLSI